MRECSQNRESENIKMKTQVKHVKAYCLNNDERVTLTVRVDKEDDSVVKRVPCPSCGDGNHACAINAPFTERVGQLII